MGTNIMIRANWPKAAALFLALFGTMNPAQAQVPIFAPCLTGSASSAALQADFEAQGWALLTDAAGRKTAAETLGEAEFLVIFLPNPPPDAAALDANMTRGHAIGLDRFLLPMVALYRRGDAVAAAYFPTAPNMSNLRCQFSAPVLPEVVAALVANTGPSRPPDLNLVSIDLPLLPYGVERTEIFALRHSPVFAPTVPLLGPDALFVTVALNLPTD
jgi:hypothetical protein